VDSSAGLDTAVAKRQNSCPCWESNSGRPAGSVVSIQTDLPQLIPDRV
jgi:hypothetical protein